MIQQYKDHITEVFGSQSLSKNGLSILMADNENDLFILIAEKYRPFTNRRKDCTHNRWVRSQLHNNTLNGKRIGNNFICYDKHNKG